MFRKLRDLIEACKLLASINKDIDSGITCINELAEKYGVDNEKDFENLKAIREIRIWNRA